MRLKVNENINLVFEVPGDDFTRAGEASGAVKNTLKKLGLSSVVIRKVAIAMYEGEINMVIHAGGGRVEVEVGPAAILMTLSDQGPGIPDIELAMQEGYSTAPESARNMGFGAGMGLANMKKYTDAMEVISQPGQGTTVRMRVDVV